MIERPQHMLMRVALGIHGDDVDAAIETYDLMSQGFFTHATPTMYNAGTPQPQMSSCFLLDIIDDSIDGIFRTLHRCALISKDAGGIGLSITKIRAQGSYIAGSGGSSNGVVPMLRTYDATARYADQGGGKRKVLGGVLRAVARRHSSSYPKRTTARTRCARATSSTRSGCPTLHAARAG